MGFVKYSEGKIRTIYEDENDALREVVSQNLKCKECGEELESDIKDLTVICDNCGHLNLQIVGKTPDEEM